MAEGVYQGEPGAKVEREGVRRVTKTKISTNDREKYQSYLCSREWSVLKEAVHERAKGICERCTLFPIAAVHHLTYERKYCERLEDLAGWCEHCHDFTHGKSDFDPDDARCKHIARYVRRVKSDAQMPGLPPKPTHAVPIEIQGRLATPQAWCQFLMSAIDNIISTPTCGPCECVGFDIDYAVEAINTLLPFDYAGFTRFIKDLNIPVQLYDTMLRLLDCEQGQFFYQKCLEEQEEEQEVDGNGR